METLLLIVGGLLLLTLGGEALVRGAVGTARRLGVSELLIGLTLVGFGTSTPELITSVEAALIGSAGIAIGNVVGSNISNALLIFATVALISPIAIDPRAVRRDGTMMVACALLLLAVGLAAGHLTRWVGILFVAALAVYIGAIWWLERGNGASAELHASETSLHEPIPAPLWQSLLVALGGLGGLLLGADLLVQGAVALARLAGISETVIGLTMVAVGTSLPELVASLVAAFKGRAGVAFGNIVGSNIYNVLGILGITAIVVPVPVPDDLLPRDWAWFVGSAVLLMVHAATGLKVTRAEGGLLLALYIAYIALLAGGHGGLPG